jgi:hypothetical protein
MTYLHETENKSCLHFSFRYGEYATDFIAEAIDFSLSAAFRLAMAPTHSPIQRVPVFFHSGKATEV